MPSRRTTPHARALHRRMTDAETALWRHLKNRGFHGVKFRRQHPVGPFVADFAAPDLKLIVEVDGGQHAGMADARRDARLSGNGWRVVRYWNTDVLKNPEGVLDDLARHVTSSPASPLAKRLGDR